MAYATVAELAAALRNPGLATSETTSLQACLDAAALEINHAIDRTLVAVVPAADWLYSDVTQAADPGPGLLRLDQAQPVDAGHVYVDPVDADSVDRQAGLQPLAAGDLLRVYDAADPSRWVEYALAGPAADQTGWFDLPVACVDSSEVAPALADGMRLTLLVLRPAPLAQQKLALANRANILRAVEWYKANDAAFGAAGSEEAGVLQAPRSSFAPLAAILTPLKQQWGIA